MTARTADRINYLNTALMVVSCVVAYAVPFELFLFSYAVLGPLHYLTEISWLHDRKYFARAGDGGRRIPVDRAWLGLVLVTLAVMLTGLLADKVFKLKVPPTAEIALFYLVFVGAALLVLVKNRIAAAALVLLALGTIAAFNGSRYFGLFALFLITIVHVLVFTAAFILLGALKGKSRSGLISLAVFAACVASFFVYAPPMPYWSAGAFVRDAYVSFQGLNAELIKLFHLGSGATLGEVYETDAGLVVMRLIAFAYTYHYLNWFSKTSVIKWHAISRPRAIAIGVAWAAALAVYARSYELGFVVLYALSALHVMLEFPLNHQTFAAIGAELRALVSPKSRGTPRGARTAASPRA